MMFEEGTSKLTLLQFYSYVFCLMMRCVQCTIVLYGVLDRTGHCRLICMGVIGYGGTSKHQRSGPPSGRHVSKPPSIPRLRAGVRPSNQSPW